METFNYPIPGGLEPGEAATWTLVPGALSSPWRTARVPGDAELVVDVERLDGADGRELFPAPPFGPEDKATLQAILGAGE